MRMMRPYSRITMVRKPLQRMLARDCSAEAIVLLSSTVPPVHDQAHEDLLEPIDLVAHAHDIDTERAQTGEELVEILILGDIGFQSMFIDASYRDAGYERRV